MAEMEEIFFSSTFGGETLITSIDALEAALAGNAGTRIHL